MVLRLIEEKKPIDYVVFYDTGMEFQAIYNLRDKMRKVFADNKITFVELKPQKPFLWTMLEREVVSRKTNTKHYGYQWCGGTCRWGTTEKLRAIRAFKKSLNDDVTDYVGIAADEPERFDKAKQEGKVLPLVDYGMTEKDCLEYCRAKGFSWVEQTANGQVDLYDVLDRVSCWCCSNKNLKELKNIYNFLPEYWNRLKELQSKIPMPFKGYTTKGERKGIYELETRFSKET